MTISSANANPASPAVTASQGAPGTAATAWFVKPTDGTNVQSFTALGEAKVSVTQALPAGANAIGSVSVSNFPATQAVSAASLPLPSGASTSALQSTGNTSLASILTQLQASIAVTGTFWQATQPVSVASLPLPSGAATSALQTSGNTSLSAIAASVAGTLAVSAASLPLPTGAATSALQTTGNTSLASIVTNTGNIPAKGSATSANSTPVVIASDQAAVPVSGTFYQATQPVSAASLPLPTGASTSALQTTGNTSLSTIATNTGNIPAKGSATGANSTPVVIASDQAAVPIKASGKATANAPVRNDYTSTSVTTGAYTQLVASLTAACSELEIFDSSGQTLVLATGVAASEVNQIYIFPGGNGRVPLSIAAGTRVSVKAISAAASVGELDINFYA